MDVCFVGCDGWTLIMTKFQLEKVWTQVLACGCASMPHDSEQGARESDWLPKAIIGPYVAS